MPDFLRRVNAQPLIFFATLAVIVAILSLAKSVLVPVALAVLLVFCLTPLVRYVQRRGLRRRPAVVLVAGVAFVVLGSLVLSILSQFVTLADELPHYEKILVQKIESTKGSKPTAFEQVVNTTKRVTKKLSGEETPVAKKAGQSAETEDNKKDPLPVMIQSDLGGLLSFYASTVAEVIQIVASIGLVVILVITMLMYREELRDRFIRLTGSGRLAITTKALDEAARRISDYLLRKSIVNAVYGLALSLLLFALGVPFAILWGVLLMVLRFIPGLGIWLSAAPPLILSLIAFESWWPMILVAGFLLLAEIICLNIVEPIFVGPQIGLMPVATMVSLTFWTWLWGPVGLLLAIPITVCLSVLGKHVEPLAFLTVLLSDQPAMSISLRYYQRLLAADEDDAAEIVQEYLSKNDQDSIYDSLLLPALIHAQDNVIHGEISPTDQEFFFRTTSEILDDLSLSREKEVVSENSPLLQIRNVVGVPVQNEGDALALQMVEQRLSRHVSKIRCCSPGLLTAEVVDWVAAQQPSVVCIASIGPKGAAQTKFLCKRLSTCHPNLKIIVARFDREGEESSIIHELKKLESVTIRTTVSEVRDDLLKAIQHQHYLQSQQEQEKELVVSDHDGMA